MGSLAGTKQGTTFMENMVFLDEHPLIVTKQVLNYNQGIRVVLPHLCHLQLRFIKVTPIVYMRISSCV
jgi:hypothetical protein